MGIKSLLIIFISLGFSMGVFADDKETKTPGQEASAMPVMEEDRQSVVPVMEKEVMFLGDFAGSYSMLSDGAHPDGDFDVNLTQFNVKTHMGRSRLNLGFGYGSTIRSLNDGVGKYSGITQCLLSYENFLWPWFYVGSF